ncbi:MAG: GntP family permease [Defluviitaleaceae bacterium]|nr:GntP family permease [Defluviitaleaceae bacterium]
MTGFPLIIVFILAVVLMILAISKLKVHPFLAIMGTAFLLAFFAGIPLVNTDYRLGVPAIIGAGFSAIFTNIGIVILFGALIGSILEATGGAFKLADMVLKVLGKVSPTLAMIIMGWIVSVPVFCDSGFVILNPVRKSLVKKTGTSGVATAVGLGAGLYTSHVLVPLTPGPLAASEMIGLGDNLLLVMIVSFIISIPVVIASYFWANYVGRKTQSKEDLALKNKETVETYETLLNEKGKLPNGLLSLAPIIMPIIFMAIGSVANVSDAISGDFQRILAFLGTPMIALAIGLLFAILLLYVSGKMAEFNSLTNETLKTMGPILFITAAGSVLGRVINESDMVRFIEESAGFLAGLGLVFPFLISAILKTAQGSSTVAMMITASIMAPLMYQLGLGSPIMGALTVMAIGAGSMAASHANDSYFWVVTNLSDMTPEQGYKNWTSMSIVQGLAAIVGIVIFSLFVN